MKQNEIIPLSTVHPGYLHITDSGHVPLERCITKLKKSLEGITNSSQRFTGEISLHT